MKIAVSDFDGTLSKLKEGATLGADVSEEDLAAIRDWRKAGHKFGIASGRGLSLIAQKLKEYDMSVDFLICSNGAAIFDGQMRLVAQTLFPEKVLHDVLHLPLFAETELPLLVFGTYQVYAVRPYPFLNEELTPLISMEEALERKDVIQLGVMFPSVEEVQSATAMLQKEIPLLKGNSNRVYLDINMHQVDKAYGIRCLLRQMDWEGSPVLAIGDDANDLPMIRSFNGFTVESARQAIKDEASKVYLSVGQMLRENI